MRTLAWAPAAVRDMRRLDPQVARQVRDTVQRYAQHAQADVSTRRAIGAGERRLPQ